MSPLFLSDKEVCDICEGLKQPAAQCRYLSEKMKVKVRRKPNGKPLVLRSAVEGLDMKKVQQAAGRNPVQPDSKGLILAFSAQAGT